MRRLGNGYAQPSRPDERGVDLGSTDGTRVLDLKASLKGVRDLNAALVRLARYAADHRPISRAALVARMPSLNARRVREEWEGLRAILKPAIAAKLGLAIMTSDGLVVIPDGDIELQRIASLASESLTDPEPHARHTATAWTTKTYEVWKVLLAAWLRGEGPLPVGQITRRSGVSHPTVLALLHRLERTGELARPSNRGATLSALPRSSLAEIVVLGEHLRRTLKFHDASGRPPDAGKLLQRIQRKAPANVGIGGVSAARHYMPDFDLHGQPGVDVTVHGRDPLAWLRAIDPALTRTPGVSGAPRPLLTVHYLMRPEPDFERDRASGARFADPAETLLDLYELRLDPQADEFVRAMRKKAGVT